MAAALAREQAKQQFHEKKQERLQSMLDEARKQGDVERLAADAKGRELDSVSDQLKQRIDSLTRDMESKAGDFGSTIS